MMITDDDAVTGPIPRSEFAGLADLPFGKAKEVIRKYDPLWGRVEGEKIEWKVVAKRSRHARGHAVVKAASKEEADKLADDLSDVDIEWDDDGDFEIETVEPKT